MKMRKSELCNGDTLGLRWTSVGWGLVDSAPVGAEGLLEGFAIGDSVASNRRHPSALSLAERHFGYFAVFWRSGRLRPMHKPGGSDERGCLAWVEMPMQGGAALLRCLFAPLIHPKPKLLIL
jgi:hypothetical protein